MIEWLSNMLPAMLVATALLIAWLVLREKAAPLDNVAEFDQRLAAGKPVILKFFANT